MDARDRGLRHRIETTRDQVVDKKNEWEERIPAVRAALRAYSHDREVSGEVMAGAIAFRTFTLDRPRARLGQGATTAALHIVTIVYVTPRVSSASEPYGPLGAAIAILGWMYLIGRLTVASAVLNASMFEKKAERP